MTRAKPRMAPSKAGIYNLPLNFAIIQICPEHLSVSELAQAKYVCQRSIPNETTRTYCPSRFPKYAKLGHFALLFWSGRQRNVGKPLQWSRFS